MEYEDEISNLDVHTYSLAFMKYKLQRKDGQLKQAMIGFKRIAWVEEKS